MSRTFQQRFLRKQKKKRDAEKPPVKQQNPPAKPDGGSRKPASSGAQLSPPPPLESTPVVNKVPPGTMEPSEALFPRDYGGEEAMGDYASSTAPKRGGAPDTEVKPPSSLVTSTPMQSATEEPSSPTFFSPLPEGPSLPVGAPKKLAKVPKSKRGLTPEQPSSVTADDWSRMTGNIIDVTTGEIKKGPAQVEVVGGTGKGYDKWATPQERQDRADQFLGFYPNVDVAGKSPDQVRSKIADAREKYLKAVEGKKAPKRESKIKRPLSERAPEYRDTKRGREYFRPLSEADGGTYSPDTGSYGVWERDPIKDRNYPDERIRDLTDKRKPEVKQAQLDLAAQLKTPLADDPNYWLDPVNAEELERFRKEAKSIGVSSKLYDGYIDRITKKVKFDIYRTEQDERQKARVENPQNWAMKGLLDPSDVASTRKRMYPDQTAEQKAITDEAVRKALEEERAKKKDKDKE